MLPVVALALAATVLLVLSGYLIGIQRDRVARDLLEDELSRRRQELAALSGLHNEIERHQRGERDLRADIRAYLKPFIPLIEREQVSRKLASIEAPATPHGALSLVLEDMAQRAGFLVLLLSDASGLPLASNAQARDIESLGALAAGVLSLSERLKLLSQPAPLAMLMQHEGGRVSLQRIFQVEGESYVLSAVTRGVLLLPDVLDPALPMIERILGRKPWEEPEE